MDGLLLVDHVNSDLRNENALKYVLGSWIESFKKIKGDSGTVELLVRAYGGWWFDGVASLERDQAFEYYQSACPSLIATHGVIARVRFEFADYLLVDTSKRAKISHSVGIRTKPERLRAKMVSGSCRIQGCASESILSWARNKKACPHNQCDKAFADRFERLEQKQVDVHLSMDLYCAAKSNLIREIAVLSADMDVMPAVLAAGICSDESVHVSLIRNARSNVSMDPHMDRVGVSLLELGEL
ncbi:MAG: hypothetical protein KF800_09615 [Lysobacter sp.]|nr:hypothetical protein [Lysobacter sp.]